MPPPSSSVLIVDDDTETLDGFRRVLAQDGFEPTVAATACDALALIGRNHFSVIVAELELPDMSALELLRILRNREKVWTPYIVISRVGTISSAVEALRLGASDFLEKPILGDVLVETVRAASGIRIGGDRSAADSRVARVLNIIGSCYSEDTLSIASIARQCGVSREHLSRLIKRETGQTFGRLLTSTRVHHAKRLLVDRSLSVKEISALVGCRNTHELDRYFRRYCGITPMTYRASVGRR